MLVVGPTGVGKTSLLRTLDRTSTVFINVEAGDLAVQDIEVDTVRPRTWPECRDLAVWIAGASPAVQASAVYGEQHHAAVVKEYGQHPDRYRSVFIDSITAISRLSFGWASEQPEAFSSSGKRDLRGAYGLHAREMIAWLSLLQQARCVSIVLLGVLETVTDDFNRTEHRLQMEGSRTSRELPAIVDQIVTMNWVKFGDEAPVRAFICTGQNLWQYPAKDRSGRLEQIEQPHLGKLFDKLTRSSGNLVQFPAAELQHKGGSDGSV
jgi:hypothetical protein